LGVGDSDLIAGKFRFSGGSNRRLHVARLNQSKNAESGYRNDEEYCGRSQSNGRVVKTGSKLYHLSVAFRLFLTLVSFLCAFGLSLWGWKNIHGNWWLRSRL
jgi:hypothetical protein